MSTSGFIAGYTYALDDEDVKEVLKSHHLSSFLDTEEEARESCKAIEKTLKDGDEQPSRRRLLKVTVIVEEVATEDVEL